MSPPESLPRETRVVVVGGGPVGLTTSALLSQRGIEHVVVERRTRPRCAPAAHVLRTRPMEVFERIGVAREIRRSAPDLALDCITWCTGLGGTEIGRLDLRAGMPAGRDVWTHCPQNVLEPILLARARREACATVRAGAECVAVDQDADGVWTALRTEDGREQRLRAKWLIAADGAGSPVRRMLGVPMIGDGVGARFFMIHFEADLRPWIEGRSGPLFWILNPQSPGTLIVHDPAKSHVFMTPQFGRDGEAAEVPERLRTALGVPADLRILAVDGWSLHVQVAERYRTGRAFLAGDAAHRFPPTGGLGLNTGILDAERLVHQLAQVEVDGADPSALDRYEAECRPAARTNASESHGNLIRLGEIAKVLGPYGDLAELERRLASLSASERERLAQAIELQRSHFVSEGALPAKPLGCDAADR